MSDEKELIQVDPVENIKGHWLDQCLKKAVETSSAHPSKNSTEPNHIHYVENKKETMDVDPPGNINLNSHDKCSDDGMGTSHVHCSENSK